MPYFYEFDTDTCETSHTVFTPFTRSGFIGIFGV